MRLLQTVAASIGLALENARLFDETKQALEQQKATAEILRVISSSMADTQPVFDKILHSCKHLFGGDELDVLLVDEQGQLQVAAYVGKARDDGAATFPAPVDITPAPGGAIRERQRRALPGRAEQRPTTRACCAVWARSRATTRWPSHRWCGKTAASVRSASPARAVRSAIKNSRCCRPSRDQAVIAIENARLFNETKEALERQTATAEVLSVISSSPSDLEPVYRTILESITRLCESQIAVLFLFDGERLSAAASHGTTTEFADLLRRGRPKPSHETTTRLAALERRTVHVADLLSDATFSPTPRDLYERENVRTVLSVPMLRDTTLIGVMTTWRREVRPFDERQIGLIQTFADQAVIAIENVRLFNETKEALEQQTATAEVLQVISSSPTDAAAGVRRHCRAAQSGCATRASEPCPARRRRACALGCASTAAHRRGRASGPFTVPLLPSSGIGERACHPRRAHRAQITDVLADTDFTATGMLRRWPGFAAILAVPMLREARSSARSRWLAPRAGAFPDKQIALLQTFADQAVIAIQNVRLFNETKEALEQQTATAEVLQVISSSVADTQPVFDKILDSCQRPVRHASSWASSWSSDDGRVHLAACAGHGARDRARHVPRAGRKTTVTARVDARAAQSCTCPMWPQWPTCPRPSRTHASIAWATARRVWRRCCGRAAASARCGDAPAAGAVLRQGDRAAGDLRRPGRDRDPERAAVQRDARRRWSSRRPPPRFCR